MFRTCFYAIFVFALLCLGAPVASADTRWTINPNHIARYYDGDTFYVNLPGLPVVFGEELPIRLLNIDTPELRSRCKDPDIKLQEKALAREARDYLIQQLEQAQVIRIQDLERGSFFRVVANVYIDDVWLNAQMVEAGYAVDVFDGKSADWCELLIGQ